MRPLLSLRMIVRDEAKSIREVLETVKHHIDNWVVLDTGSTDGTQGIVVDSLAHEQIPVPRTLDEDFAIDSFEHGLLVNQPFEGYAASRNRVAAYTQRNAAFQLVLSGDEYLRNGERLREILEQHRGSDVDLFRIRVDVAGETSQMSPRIFRTGSAWHYEDGDCGVHEFPAHPDPAAKIVDLEDVYIEHIVSDPERRISNIWDVHVPLLEAALKRNPDNERALVLLATTCYGVLLGYDGFSAGEKVSRAMEVMSYCKRRLDIQTGQPAERNYVRYCYLKFAQIAGVYSDAELLARAEELRADDPHRPEVAMLCAMLSVKLLPLHKVFEYSIEAARVSLAARSIQNSSPVSPAIAWQAHRLAAVAARQMSQRHPNEEKRAFWRERCEEQVAAGIAAGGPENLFQGIADDVIPAPADFESAAPPSAS